MVGFNMRLCGNQCSSDLMMLFKEHLKVVAVSGMIGLKQIFDKCAREIRQLVESNDFCR